MAAAAPAVKTAFVVAALAAFWLPQWYMRWSPEHAISDEEARKGLVALRALLAHQSPTVQSKQLAGPVVATLWLDGEVRFRAQSTAPDLSRAIADVGKQLVAQTATIDPAVVARATLKLDVVTATGALPHALAGITVRPGVDGVIVDDGLVTPDDILTAGLPPWLAIPSVDLRLGIDHAALSRMLHRRGRNWRRARVAQFVEGPLRVERGHAVATPTVDEAALQKAAQDAGDYLANHLASDGTFDYLYYVGVDQGYREEEDAALTRQAGSTWYLASLGGNYLAAADRALDHLSRAHAPGLVAVSATDADRAGLGASALTLAALSERAKQGPVSTATAEWAAQLTALILSMQRPDGDFQHVFLVAERRPDPTPRLPYYSGEAAFGLAKRWQAVAEAAVAEALDRAIGFLTRTSRLFVLDFIFLEDHWTCIAADAAWDALRPATQTAAAAYCEAFAKFLGRAQFTVADSITEAQPDFAGAYGFSPLLAPHPTPVGSRTEALLATLSMAQRRHAPPRVITALTGAIQRGLGFLLRHQLGTTDYLFAAPARAHGGFLFSDEDRVIRIDFVQHAGAALLRASHMHLGL